MDFSPQANSLSNTHGIVCAPGSPILDVIRASTRIAASDATVLLTGETGTGKEVFARMIHQNSVRSRKPFVPVNCAAIPEALLESELFGYVRGAFTGAVGSRRGRVALAESGTLFLDEVGDLPLSLQVKLLRLLQNHSYEPVGSAESVTGDFRLITATNRDLAEDVRTGRFRRDLYYRLHVCPLVLPPLRDRRRDVGALFFHFWNKHGETRVVSPTVIQRLELYSWPGNVRELENLVERVSVCAESAVIGIADLPVPYRDGSTPNDIDTCTPSPVLDMENAGVIIEIAESAKRPPLEERPSGAHTGAEPDTIVIPSSPDRSLPPDVSQCYASSKLDYLANEPLITPTPMPVTIGSASAAILDFATTHSANHIAPPTIPFRLPVDLPRLLRETEESYIQLALAQSHGNKKEAAKLLGMGRTTLVEKLRRKAALTEALEE
jgi:sigma-54 specific flagellar transcriptional regulator A